MGKEIVILASGTRGDVQPYLALGLGLQSAGYRVSVAAPVAFRQMVEGFGFPLLRDYSDAGVSASEPASAPRREAYASASAAPEIRLPSQ
jgi:UDP:flavonoid glycosyltransferase YjiC (YdhE family)